MLDKVLLCCGGLKQFIVAGDKVLPYPTLFRLAVQGSLGNQTMRNQHLFSGKISMNM